MIGTPEHFFPAYSPDENAGNSVVIVDHRNAVQDTVNGIFEPQEGDGFSDIDTVGRTLAPPEEEEDEFPDDFDDIFAPTPEEKEHPEWPALNNRVRKFYLMLHAITIGGFPEHQSNADEVTAVLLNRGWTGDKFNKEILLPHEEGISFKLHRLRWALDPS